MQNLTNGVIKKMREVLATITERKAAFARLPFFAFLADESLTPEQRLSFYPCMAHWIMSFADLNKYFLRVEPTADPIQERVNTFSHEDDDHWLLYLEDFQTLGFNQLYTSTGLLKLIWSDETRAGRRLSYRISHLIMEAQSVQRLAIIEAMEEAADIFFNLTIKLADQIQERTGKQLRYLGHFHFDLEAEHTGAGDHESLAQIELDEATQRRTIEMVDEVYRLFEDWMEELLRYAGAQLSDSLTPAPAPPQHVVSYPQRTTELSRVM